MNVLLLVLAKAPEAGKAKTRLSPPATPRGAAQVAAAALLDTLAAVSTVDGATVVVALAGDLDRAERADDLRAALDGCTVIGQRGGPFGERIAAAHADAAAVAPGLPVLQIGMDTPQITATMLDNARATLAVPGTDAVLGPADDGGWWILGLRDPAHAALIADVPTSRADTGERTEHALRTAGLTVAPLPTMSDVDTADDARAVAPLIPHGRFAAAVKEIL